MLGFGGLVLCLVQALDHKGRCSLQVLNHLPQHYPITSQAYELGTERGTSPVYSDRYTIIIKAT
jgi:hypothetical protein